MRKRLKDNLSYQTVLCLFLFGSVAGFVFEGLFALVKRGAWENHSATVWGPFCIIYGVGAVAVYFVSLILYDKSMPEQFLMFAVAGSAVEYFGSFLQEKIFGSTSWDYSGRILNIHGRICLEMSIIWGILGLGFARLIFPYLMKFLDLLRAHSWRAGIVAITVFMAVNLMISAAAILRWRDRLNGVPPHNRVETYIDARYGEDVMERVYGNMRFDSNAED